MSRPKLRLTSILIAAILLIAIGFAVSRSATVNAKNLPHNSAVQNAINKVQQGEQIFRFDTFGDEAFWGDTLKLHQAIEGVSPLTALGVGLKVDIDALPSNLLQ